MYCCFLFCSNSCLFIQNALYSILCGGDSFVVNYLKPSQPDIHDLCVCLRCAPRLDYIPIGTSSGPFTPMVFDLGHFGIVVVRMPPRQYGFSKHSLFVSAFVFCLSCIAYDKHWFFVSLWDNVQALVAFNEYGTQRKYGIH